MVTEKFVNLPQIEPAEEMVESGRETGPESVIEVRNLQAYYGEIRALKDISLSLYRRRVSAVIGPSGCGKSTLVRCLNRMHEMSSGGHVEGEVLYQGENIYGTGVDPVELRSRIGMVFQKPNPFPKSIYENVAFGLKVNGIHGNTSERVERSLRRAALWEEVKDRLKQSALQLSGGQQQRLCIARALAVEPEVILMDEPCSALDPMATLAVEELIRDLSQEVTIIIVTHNMQQAARVSHHTAFLMMDQDRAGYLVEYGPTSEVFTNPKSEHTEAYITGRFS